MELGIDLKQKQVLSQQMLQSMEILQMSAQELETYITELSMENPTIELPDSFQEKTDSGQEDIQRRMDWLESTDQQNRVYYQQERSAQDMQTDWHDSRDLQESLSDYLFAQLMLADYTQTQREILEFMILSLDSRGYFTENIADVAAHFSVEEDVILNLLADIQKLDPAGVGARDLKECLLLQLARRKNMSPLPEQIIRCHLEDVAKNHLHIIARKLGVSPEEVFDACREIQSLNPKPGNSFSNREQLRYITPDAFVVKLEDHFEILINESRNEGFTISDYYQNMLKQTTDRETQDYLREKLSQAQWVNNCIAQRGSTLSRVVHALVEKQREFFLYGAGHKCPMRLTDLADMLDLHESTVSRALRGKYLQCTWGVFPLNYFLTSVSTVTVDYAEEKAPEQMKQMIRELIEAEDKRKPLSDQAISDRLRERQISLSRRTVNKYRTEMGIPDKSGRKIYG